MSIFNNLWEVFLLGEGTFIFSATKKLNECALIFLFTNFLHTEYTWFIENIISPVLDWLINKQWIKNWTN